MIDDRNLQELVEYKAKGPVVSVYLNTDPAQGNADRYKLILRSMLKEVELTEDVQVILRYFDHEHDWQGRGVAVFSCAAEGFFKVINLATPLRSRVRVNETPHVKPLVDLLDSYGGYGVVLVDKQGARLFNFHLGQLREQDGVMGEAVRHTKRGGGSQSAGRRGGTAGQTDYEDELADRNMREIAEYARHFFSENKVRRILIGGSEDNIALFRSHLPKSWQSLVVGDFPVSMNASHTEVLERAMQVGMQAEQQRESRLAEAVVTGAAKGRGGVLRLEETLAAIHAGRVQTLLIREGFRAPGNRCTGCGFISSLPMEICPFCGAQTQELPDAVELAVRHVIQAGGDVEVLQSDHEVKGFEQIGALLRY
jgi:peptide subunit release factor 1 (eRF1)